MIRVPTASTSTLSDNDDTPSQDQSIILRDSNRGNGFIRNNNFNDNNNNNNNNDNNSNDDINDDDDVANRFFEQHHQIQFDQTSFESTMAQSSLLVWAVYENHKEFLLGTCAAISVFLTVILVFLIHRRKSRTNIDKAPLVDNEVSVNVDVDRLTIHV